jgi:hypothetical protein
MVGECFGIGFNTFAEFAFNANVIDQHVALKDIDINFIATKAGTKTPISPLNPKKLIVRHNFLEIFLRIAEDKYLKPKIVTCIFDAVKMLFDDVLIPEMKKYDPNEWRKKAYWCEEVDAAYKSYQAVTQHIFTRYAIRKSTTGICNYLNYHDLVAICNDAGILNKDFGDRDVILAFRRAQMLQVNELTSNRSFQMSYVEYLEAIARIADEVSLPQIGGDTGYLALSPDMLKLQPLCLKLEAFLVRLLEKCVDPQFKDLYNIPNVSIFDVDFESRYHAKRRTFKSFQSIQAINMKTRGRTITEVKDQNV